MHLSSRVTKSTSHHNIMRQWLQVVIVFAITIITAPFNPQTVPTNKHPNTLSPLPYFALAMSIPATATAAAGAGRTIGRVVAPTRINPALNRLIGTVDIDGSGTTHSLPDVNPFILLDCGTIPKNGMPGFGAHPHYGHSVVSILIQGKVRSWDSYCDPADPPTVLEAPASYWVDAGSGVFHDERSVIDNEDDPKQHMKLFQLWTGVTEADRSKPARVQHTSPGSLPKVDCLDPVSGKVVGHATIHVGEGSGVETLYPISVMHVTQQAGTTHHVSLVPTHGGFVVHMKGKATYGEGDMTATVENPDTVLVLANTDNPNGPDYLQVTCESSEDDEDLEYLVCSGQRLDEPWVKKLVANGAIFTKTEEQARALAPKVEEMSKTGKAEGGSFAPFGRP